MAAGEPHIVVNDLTMAYGDFVIQRDLNFVAGGCAVHSFGYARTLRTAWHHLALFLEHRRGRQESWRASLPTACSTGSPLGHPDQTGSQP